MSRSGYNEDWCDNWPTICWRGAVTSSIRGKRGQAFLKELAEALDAMPERRLISGVLSDATGNVCAIGALGVRRGVDLDWLDPEDPDQIAGAFGVAAPLVRELEFMNDEVWWNVTPEDRWRKIRSWVASQIKKPDEVTA